MTDEKAVSMLVACAEAAADEIPNETAAPPYSVAVALLMQAALKILVHQQGRTRALASLRLAASRVADFEVAE